MFNVTAISIFKTIQKEKDHFSKYFKCLNFSTFTKITCIYDYQWNPCYFSKFSYFITARSIYLSYIQKYASDYFSRTLMCYYPTMTVIYMAESTIPTFAKWKSICTTGQAYRVIAKICFIIYWNDPDKIMWAKRFFILLNYYTKFQLKCVEKILT